MSNTKISMVLLLSGFKIPDSTTPPVLSAKSVSEMDLLTSCPSHAQHQGPPEEANLDPSLSPGRRSRIHIGVHPLSPDTSQFVYLQ